MVYSNHMDEIVDALMAQLDAEELEGFERPVEEEDFYEDYLEELYW